MISFNIDEDFRRAPLTQYEELTEWTEALHNDPDFWKLEIKHEEMEI